ncbi:hypothetical protein JHK85_054762 [Glycine max]|nr:hypothetical protein JHK85_054762 [Glycine max]
MQRFNHDSGTKTRQAPIHIGSCWNRIQSCDAYGESYDTNYHGGELSTNSYINLMCKQQHYREALDTFNFHLKNSSIQLEPSTYVNLILACTNVRSLKYGKRIHDHILKSNCQPDLVLQNHILNMYGKCGSLKDARKAFDTMQLRSVVSWTIMISGYSQNGQENDAIIMYIQMLRSGYFPDQLTFGSIIKACCIAGDIDLGGQLHGHVIKSGYDHHLIAQNALISMYTKFGQIAHASDVFTMISTKDLISWASMITGFTQLGYEIEALYLFRDMFRQGVYQPNEFIFGSVFSACRSLLKPEFGRQIQGMCAKFGLGRNVFAGCSLCDMYAKFGFLPSAKRAFYQIESPDLVSWNAIIAALANSDVNEAIYFFCQMIHMGLMPDDITFLNLLCACGSPMTLNQGMQIHSYIIKMGLDKVAAVCNSLLTMYTKCSNLHDAFNVFKDISENGNLVSWNAILSACSQHKQPGEAFRLFKLMLFSENKPDNITITTILGTCAELVSLEVGNQVHCFSVKKRAAENILKLDPSNSAALVLLSNIHASAGNWKEVARLRNLMKQMGVQKVPGQSWIEVKDQIHVFFSEDSSHPQRGNIYTMLEDLWLQMLDDGYDPCQRLDISIW